MRHFHWILILGVSISSGCSQNETKAVAEAQRASTYKQPDTVHRPEPSAQEQEYARLSEAMTNQLRSSIIQLKEVSFSREITAGCLAQCKKLGASEAELAPIRFAAIRTVYDALESLRNTDVTGRVSDVEIERREALVAFTKELRGVTDQEKVAFQQGVDIVLLTAIDRRNEDLMLLALAAGANANCEFKGVTPLLLACKRNSLKDVKTLVDAGADINFATVEKDTALHVAILMGDEQLVRFLVSKGADVNARTKQGSTPLSLARSDGKFDVAALLKEAGAK